MMDELKSLVGKNVVIYMKESNFKYTGEVLDVGEIFIVLLENYKERKERFINIQSIKEVVSEQDEHI